MTADEFYPEDGDFVFACLFAICDGAKNVARVTSLIIFKIKY